MAELLSLNIGKTLIYEIFAFDFCKKQLILGYEK
jgi:hypothetical protein